ncbi:hypothetical protein C2S51_000580 [Perilla frutescens var. frutescens]|nr:hypothetical protein C2S51_000580 [Perilla frutescens var. frutescens]
MVSKDGGNTPSSGHGSSPLGLDNINLEANFEAEVERNVVQKRRIRWTLKNNDVLARCWVSTNEDSMIRTNKKLDQFWVRVTIEYNNNHPANTPQGWGSGHNDVDILMETLKKWEHNHNGESFKLLDMWQILKDCPKWNNPDKRDHCGKKKMKTPM